MKTIKATSNFKYYKLPKPAKVFIPEWYKKIPTYFGSDKFQWRNFSDNRTLKHCMPFLDAFQTGYMVELQQDLSVEIDKETGLSSIFWGVDPHPVFYRGEKKYETVPAPTGHSDQEFTWMFRYSIKLPKGYSMLMVHPLNRYELPFTTLSGVHDSDTGLYEGKIPFYIKSDFEGIIPSGTPILQMIPIKREAWKMVEDKSLLEENNHQEWIGMGLARSLYKTTKWSRKQYE